MKRKPPILPFTQTGMVFLVWLAFLFLLLLLTACSSGTVTRSLPVSGGGTDLADSRLSYLVDTETREETASADDGTLLAACTYELPSMSVLRKDGTTVTAEDAVTEEERTALSHAETFNREFLRWTEEADFSALADIAREDYAWRTGAGDEWAGAYQQILTCTRWQTDRLVSVAGEFYYYGGGAHPNRVSLGWNFDTRSGTFLTAGQLFSDVESVTAELIRQADNRARELGCAPEEMFWPDYRTTLEGWSDAPAVTFNGQEMTVSYSPYDLASYAAGGQVFTIPMPWLDPYLSGYGRELLGRGQE